MLERLSGGRNLAQLREGPHMVMAAVVTEIFVHLRLEVSLSHQRMHLAEPDRVQAIAAGFRLGNRAAAPINETLHHVPLLRPLLRLGVAPLQELSQVGHHHLFRRHLQQLFRGLRRAACFGLQRGSCRRWR